MAVPEQLDLYVYINKGTSFDFAGFSKLANCYLCCEEAARSVGETARKVETAP